MAVLHPLVAGRVDGRVDRRLALHRPRHRSRRSPSSPCCPIGIARQRLARLGGRRQRSACACSSWPATSGTSSDSIGPQGTEAVVVDLTRRRDWRTMRLLDPVTFGSRAAPNRVMFGPHVTNLGDDDRRLTERHVAYYARRARGGCGTIVIEGASVHESDWPYERAPLAGAVPRRMGSRSRSPAAARRAGHRRPRPRRRTGIVGVQPTSAVGPVACSGGQHA